jgi:hypothetical protein
MKSDYCGDFLKNFRPVWAVFMAMNRIAPAIGWLGGWVQFERK